MDPPQMAERLWRRTEICPVCGTDFRWPRRLAPRARAQPGTKTAGWRIGHLAVSGDFARDLLGRPSFVLNRVAGAVQSRQPAFRECLDDVTVDTAVRLEVYRTSSVGRRIRRCSPPRTQLGPAQPQFPTAGDFVAYLISSHLAYHLGTACRLARGRWPRTFSPTQPAGCLISVCKTTRGRPPPEDNWKSTARRSAPLSPSTCSLF